MKTDNISIVLSGEAGQGLNTLQFLLLQSFFNSSYYVFSCKEYMSRVRGVNNTLQLRIGKNNKSCYMKRIGLMIVLNNGSIECLQARLSPETMILGREKDIEAEYVEVHKARFLVIDDILKQLGSQIYFNVIILDVITGIFGLEAEQIETSIMEKVAAKGQDIAKKNKTAFTAGLKIAADLDLKYQIEKAEDLANHNFLTGTEALGIGAVAGNVTLLLPIPCHLLQGCDHFLQICHAVRAECIINCISKFFGIFIITLRRIITSR